MNQFESVEQIQNNIDLQGEYFNAFVCEQLESYFEQRGCKLPIEFVKSVNEKTYINQNGAKRYSLLRHLLLKNRGKAEILWGIDEY